MIINYFTTAVNVDEVTIFLTFKDDTTDKVVLEAKTTIVGSEQKAAEYISTFIKDLEHNFPQIVNIPIEPDPVSEGEMI